MGQGVLKAMWIIRPCDCFSKNGANAIIANSDRGRAVRVTSDTNSGVEGTGHIGVDAQTVAFAPPNQ